MEMTETILLDAGWLFFAAWGMVLMAVSVIAFGRDLLGIEREPDAPSQEVNH
jgi:hypothetical protein